MKKKKKSINSHVACFYDEPRLYSRPMWIAYKIKSSEARKTNIYNSSFFIFFLLSLLGTQGKFIAFIDGEVGKVMNR